MKGLTIVLFFVSIITFSCGTQKQATTSEVTHLIYPFEGVDHIICDSSGVKDIKRTYPDIEIEKYWVTWGNGTILPFFFIGYFHTRIAVKDEGLTFFLAKDKHRFQKRTLNSVVVDSTSAYRTINNIGIGSSYQDVVKEFGVPDFSRGSTPGGNVTNLSYSNENNQNIVFRYHGFVDSTNFVVQNILVY